MLRRCGTAFLQKLGRIPKGACDQAFDDLYFLQVSAINFTVIKVEAVDKDFSPFLSLITYSLWVSALCLSETVNAGLHFIQNIAWDLICVCKYLALCSYKSAKC